MNNSKFLVFGENTKLLAKIKNTLVSNGYNFLGFSKEYINIIRHVRNKYPDFIIIEVNNNFKELRSILEVIEDELLVPCILVVESRTDEIFEFMLNTKTLTYLTTPIFDENLLQTTEMTLLNFMRIIEYEKKLNKLNETLESRKIVEKAKWILVEKEGYTEAEAYEVIKKKSRDNRMRMRDIANAVILTKG